MKDIIQKEHHFNHPINTVWDAITKAEEISAWFIQADFKAEVGYEYTFTHEDTTIKGKVLEANPVTHLTYTWIVGDPNTITTVKWVLEEVEGGTKLFLEHSGISTYPSENMATAMFENFTNGWANCINQLDKFLNKTPA